MIPLHHTVLSTLPCVKYILAYMAIVSYPVYHTKTKNVLAVSFITYFGGGNVGF